MEIDHQTYKGPAKKWKSLWNILLQSFVAYIQCSVHWMFLCSVAYTAHCLSNIIQPTRILKNNYYLNNLVICSLEHSKTVHFIL